MLASSSTDASICLKCHLRQALRQIAPRSRSSFQQCRRYQSTETSNHGAGNDNGAQEDGTRRDPPIRKHGGPTHGGSREPRFKQTSAKLPIASMSQETEVIVLRAIPKRKIKAVKEQSAVPPLDSKPADSPVRSALTARDIQSFGDTRKQEVQQNEVNQSINGLRFGEKDAVVSSGQYDAKVGELCRSYNINQMRKYAASHRIALPLRIPERRSLSVTAPGTNGVSITPWAPFDKQKDVPEGKVPKEQLKDTTAKDKRMFAKRRAADDILRNCWGVKLETELAQKGDLIINLAPDQFNLWSNSTSPQVDQVQPSSRFYRNSRLSASAADNTITIRGPRAEAESMADILRQAFIDSVTQRLDLLPLEPLLDGSSSKWNFADLFSPSQLKHVMNLTNTYVRYSTEDKNLKIKGFMEKDVNDAHRVLMSLLPLPSGTRGISLMTGQNNAEGRYLVPNPNTKGLPYRDHLQQLGRLVTPVTARTSRDKRDAEDLKDVASIDEQDDIVDEVVKKLSTQSVWSESRGIHKRGFCSPYWGPNAKHMPWEAKIGYALQPMNGHGPVKVESSPTLESNGRAGQVSTSETTANGTFLPAFPAHLGVLQRLGHVSYLGSPDSSFSTRRERRPRMLLKAKLTPSPFTEFGPLASIIFPPIEVLFTKETHLPLSLLGGNASSEPQINDLKFKNMRAILSHEVVNVSLPFQPADLQFSRRTILRSRDAGKDARIAAFLSEVIENERRKEGVIRAPESLRLNIPVNILAIESARRGQFKARFDKALQKRLDEAQGEEIEALYLFSGFEYSERRFVDMGDEDKGVYFSPNHVLRVEHVEGGLTNGKRLQASVVLRRSNEADVAPAKHVSSSPLPLPAITGPTATFAPISAAREENDDERKLVRTSLSLIDLVKGIQAHQIAVKPATQLSVRERARKRRQQSMQEQERRAGEGRFDGQLSGEGRDQDDSASAKEWEGGQGGDVSASDFLAALGMADKTAVEAQTGLESEGGISQRLDEEFEKEDEEREEGEEGAEASLRP